MNKLITLVATALLIIGAGTAKAQDNVNIGKSNIKLNSRMMTPEALWAMGRIGGVAASPNGSQVVYQVGYYSVKQNKGHQVICITHLPQIAAMADVHFVIEKSSTDETTITDIRRTSEEESQKELARLLGSDVLTEAALTNAREMKEMAAGHKNSF